jgi:hypothetical protein
MARFTARWLLSAAVAALAMVCCTAEVGVNVTCAAGVTGTRLYHGFAAAGCGLDCDALYCACLGGVYTVTGTGNATSGNSTGNATSDNSTGNATAATRTCAFGGGAALPSCESTAACLRSRVVCLNQYATSNGVASAAPSVAAREAGDMDAANALPTEGPVSGQCKLTANPLKVALLAVAAGTEYAGSAVASACAAVVCDDYLAGLTLQVYARCGNNTALSVGAVCKADAERPASPSLTAQIRIGGTGIDAAYLADTAGVSRAIQADLARALGLEFTFVDVTGIRIGSLIVDFRVFLPAGQNLAAALARLGALTAADLATLAQVTGVALTVEVTQLQQVTAPPSGNGIVTGQPLAGDGGSDCGKGCIAGIVVGSFAFVVLLIAGGLLIMHRHNSAAAEKEKSEPTRHAAASREPTAVATEQV